MSAPRVFVSHSSMDAAYCRALIERLRAAGADVWYDDDNLRTGQVWHTIERELRSRPNFVVILTPSALASKEVERECRWADTLYGDGSVTLLQPVIAGTISPRDIWLHLRDYKRIEARGGGPVSADEAATRLCDLLGIRAIQAYEGLSLQDVQRSQHQQITNVVSHSFGIVMLDKSSSPPRPYLLNVVKKQDSLPLSRTVVLLTEASNQASFEVQIMENEALTDTVEDIANCIEIGSALIEGLPPALPKGSPIFVTFMLDEQGRLHITCLEPSSGRRTEATIQTSETMAEEDVNTTLKRAESSAAIRPPHS